MWELLNRMGVASEPKSPASRAQLDPSGGADPAAFGDLLADLNSEVGALSGGAAFAEAHQGAQQEAPPDDEPAPQPAANLGPAPILIEDFDAERDALVLEATPDVLDDMHPDSLVITPRGEDALVLLDGEPLFEVVGGAQSVTFNAIRVVAARGA